jgi:hypothetical protein
MRRLLHVRDVEEEQYRMALETALGAFHALEHARAVAIMRQHAGREFLSASALTGEITDRTAALVEVKFAVRCVTVLAARLADAENNVMHAREAYIDKRIERRQAATLIEEAEAQEEIESLRRAQQSLDETYGASLHRGKRGAGKRPTQTST